MRLQISRSPALQARTIHFSPIRRNIPQWPNPPVPQPQVTPLDSSDPHHEGHRRSRSGKSSFWKEWANSASFQAALTTVVGLGMVFGAGVGYLEWANSASFQAALTTVVGLGMVFGAGVGYLEWYKAHVLHRVSYASDEEN
jgi:hypothetical protein